MLDFSWSNQKFEDQRLLALRYSEPHRYYHNSEHAYNVYQYCMQINSEYDNDALSSFQIQFYKSCASWHDAVYNVGSKTNEIDSVELFLTSSTVNKLINPQIESISETILATFNHWDANNEHLGFMQKIFLDADIYELSAHWDIFQLNASNILKEFSTIYSPEEVLLGRKKWYESLLEKERVFWICENRDNLARKNLERGIKHCCSLP
jgi:predicted metal-dependent HD superfamily phosphohydrolase